MMSRDKSTMRLGLEDIGLLESLCHEGLIIHNCLSRPKQQSVSFFIHSVTARTFPQSGLYPPSGFSAAQNHLSRDINADINFFLNTPSILKPIGPCAVDLSISLVAAGTIVPRGRDGQVAGPEAMPACALTSPP